MADRSWRERAACRPRPGLRLLTDLFVPTPGDEAAILTAQSICGVCSVREECAAARGRDEGVWGGRYHATATVETNRARKAARAATWTCGWCGEPVVGRKPRRIEGAFCNDEHYREWRRDLLIRGEE